MTNVEIKSNEVIYYAYGTLLELDEIHKYCPTAESLGVFRLIGFRLGFAACGPDPSSGGCTLVKDPGNTMYGILYKMPLKERQILDKASGYDTGLWAKLDITVLNSNDEPFQANTSFIPDPSGSHAPPVAYTRPILAGAKSIPLPTDYIAQLEAIIKDAS
ncbi:MAG: gamma-glutamylcyclotransferase [bacterium]|nr:gamma-glutamylcyclotransferase [bacterium]